MPLKNEKKWPPTKSLLGISIHFQTYSKPTRVSMEVSKYLVS